MKISLKRINSSYNFETVNENGDIVLLDNRSEDVLNGSSPMDLLLRAIAGCSSIDIVYILKKQKIELDNIKVEVEGIRKEGNIPNVFTEIILTIFIEGDLPEAKLLRAAELSFTKYCSVSKMLEKAAKINYVIFLNGSEIKV
ncbi:OsmC family protein [Mesonia sp. K7]|uniref:OsmC family protein n=1 Tax=Mesonia sp. K7 TaxID=2218606 RepID=UPI000DA7B6E9|nr:OsmC family protein [Mesonia sp. K7]PZD78625.1 OsmC family peroxiredoxin [Mesonia sp. K7]